MVAIAKATDISDLAGDHRLREFLVVKTKPVPDLQCMFCSKDSHTLVKYMECTPCRWQEHFSKVFMQSWQPNRTIYHLQQTTKL